ncbi:hypothetical protein AKJ57_03875 [candidate division MSBL1 archaeon SCGC-AAA259A05]|uniref:NADP-dependent oxidoreductase domain-containing protein n=1 Tax=candidate division MSBL1 archaeon SCGC-AAA259A05 TaxID=1698259 RepID=A0A133U9A5_9EURY|nr:hypothetical protein AKJ57_03875 [candidate division MSBL1 archaeon SCGC-AAA259A05]
MKYRTSERTGLKISELGVGGHEYRPMLNSLQFPGEEVSEEEFSETQPERNEIIGRAVDAGINYFDPTMREEAKSLGEALQSLDLREEVHVAAESIYPLGRLEENSSSKWQNVVIDEVEERLNLLQTDYVDVFNVHCPESNYSRGRLEATVEALEKMEEENKVRSIGASSHEPSFLSELIKKYDCFDSVMIPYNYHFQRAKENLFPACKARNVGVVVMKPLSWPYYGLPFTLFSLNNLETGQCTPAQTSKQWILESPEVSTVVVAINSVKELEENMAALEKEGEVNEKALEKCLKFALGPEGKERLRELAERPELDLRNYARKALNAEQYGWSVIPNSE